MQPLRIGIDVTPLRGLKTGVGFYLENLLLALRKRPEVELTYFTGFGWVTDPVAADATASRTWLPMQLLGRVAGALGPLAAQAKETFNDICVRPQFNDHARFGLNVVHHTELQVYKGSTPAVLTIFDLSCLRHPETHPATRVAWHRRQLPRALAAAAHVITISEFSRREISNYFGVPTDRLSVTHCGVSRDFRPRASEATRATLEPFGLRPQEYFLTVGTMEPRKNLATLIRAHAALEPSLQSRFPLVVVGKQGWKAKTTMTLAASHHSHGTLKLLGYVDSEVLPWLYAGAMAFAYPSLYEGFGLPPLEAMASGTPTVVSQCSSLPEVVGDAALQVSPMDVEDWRQALTELANNEALRTRLSTLGLAQASKFSWEQTADQTLRVYQMLATASTPRQ